MGCKESKPIFPDQDEDRYGPKLYTTLWIDETQYGRIGNPERIPAIGLIHPMSIAEMLKRLEELDRKLSDPRRFMSKGGHNLEALWEAMWLDYEAKYLEVRAVQCQAKCFDELATSDKTKETDWERAILDYGIGEVRARAASEIISVVVPDIYSHPERAKAYKEWKKFLGWQKQWRSNAKMRCAVARKK